MPPEPAPLGEDALLYAFPSEREAQGFGRAVKAAGLGWVTDVVVAYVSVGVYLDGSSIWWHAAREALAALPLPADGPGEAPGRLHTIPCCYEFELDLARVAAHAGTDAEGVIALHSGAEYTVYAIGFCPGFPYLGYLPAGLSGVPRLAEPRLRVPAGSVGVAGRQTGVYTLGRPGGWNILGRTPLTLVEVAGGYFPIEVGDRVRFARIDAGEYRRLEGGRL